MYIPSIEAEIRLRHPDCSSKAWLQIRLCGPRILPEHDGKCLLLQYGEHTAIRRAILLESGVIFATMASPVSLVFFGYEELEKSGMELVGVVKRISVDVEKAPSGVGAPDGALGESNVVFSVA